MSSIRSLFATPLWRTSLLRNRGGLLSALDAQRLETTILHTFAAASPVSDHVQQCYAELAASARNNEFYQHQLDHSEVVRGGFPNHEADLLHIDFARCDTFALLRSAFRQCARTFLRECYGQSEAQAQNELSGRSLFVWASVHEDGSEHPLHVHADALISGVYFVSVPDGSGPFTVADPRGYDRLRACLEPPFDAQHTVEPTAGELLLFPGWLPHRVGASRGVASPRVSVSFNLLGRWAELPGHEVRLQRHDDASGEHIGRVERHATAVPAQRALRRTSESVASVASGAAASTRRAPRAAATTAGSVPTLPCSSSTPTGGMEEVEVVPDGEAFAALLTQMKAPQQATYTSRPAGMPARRAGK